MVTFDIEPQASVLPPSRFEPLSLKGKATYRVVGANGLSKSSTTAAQARGRKLEKVVFQWLKDKDFDIEPCLSCAGRFVYPDAVLPPSTVVEVKARMTIDAFQQLVYLYEPMLKSAFNSNFIRKVLISPSVDLSIPLQPPYKWKLLSDFGEELKDKEIGVWSWTS